MRLRTIQSAKPLPHNRIKLAWGDGLESVVHLGPVLAKCDVFAFLHDPAAFKAVAVGPRGRTLVWPDAEGDEIDLCADALCGHTLVWHDAGGGAHALWRPGHHGVTQAA